MARRVFQILLVLASVVLVAHATAPTSPPASAPTTTRLSRQDVVARYARLPLSFHPNLGRTEPGVRFTARGPGYVLALKDRGVALRLSEPSRPADAAQPGRSALAAATSTLVDLRFVGADLPQAVTGLEPLPGVAHFYVGNDPSRWRTNVAAFARVRYQNLYPGIDVIYYGAADASTPAGHPQQLEYDLVVAPGADPNRIALAFDGVDRIDFAANGDLLLQTPAGVLRHRKPLVYQEIAGRRAEISGRYVQRSDASIAFSVDDYDRRAALVIDPVFTIGFSLGGDLDDWASDIAVDASGNPYVAGTTASENFAGGPLGGGTAAFVAALDDTGTAVRWVTFLDGAGSESALSILLRPNGDVGVAGVTSSTDFPTTAGVVQPTYGGGESDAFVSLFTRTGLLLAASLWGGDNREAGSALAADAAGNLYLAAETNSTNCVTTEGAFRRTREGPSDAWVTKFVSDLLNVDYSTLVGGNGQDGAPAIALDASGNPYVTGFTDSTDVPFLDPLRPVNHGDIDAFVAKLINDGKGVEFAYRHGGSAIDRGQSIAVDHATGDATVVGATQSTDQSLKHATRPANAGGSDVMILRIDAHGAWKASDYWGGSRDDHAADIACGSTPSTLGSCSMAGYSYSPDLPGASALHSSSGTGLFRFANSTETRPDYHQNPVYGRGNVVKHDCGDWDSNGTQDCMAYRRHGSDADQNDVVYLSGDGSGAFTSRSTTPLPGANDLVMARTNFGDADPDLVVALPQGLGLIDNVMGVLEGSIVPFASTPAAVTRVFAAPLTVGATVPALVYTVAGVNAIHVLRPAPGSGYLAPQTYSLPGEATSVAFGDLDNDGDLDMLVSTATVIIGFRNTNGQFAAFMTFPGAHGGAVLIAHLRGSGSTQVVAVDPIAGTLRMTHLLSGAPPFTQTFAAGNTPIAVVFGDFNGDTKIDLAVATRDGLLYFFNASPPISVPQSFVTQLATGGPTAIGPTHITAVELTGDSVAEIVAAGVVRSSGFFLELAADLQSSVDADYVSGVATLLGLALDNVGNRYVAGSTLTEASGSDIFVKKIENRNPPPQFTFDVSTNTLYEGDPLVVSGSTRNALSMLSYWDDGTPPESVARTGAADEPYTLTHLYQDDGVFDVSITVTDQFGRSATLDEVITVNNVSPTVSAMPNQTVAQHQTVLVVVPFSDPGTQDTFTYNLDFGDGTSTSGDVSAVNGSGRVAFNHVYQVPDTYTARVTVADDDGGNDTSQFTIAVTPSAVLAFSDWRSEMTDAVRVLETTPRLEHRIQTEQEQIRDASLQCLAGIPSGCRAADRSERALSALVALDARYTITAPDRGTGPIEVTLTSAGSDDHPMASLTVTLAPGIPGRLVSGPIIPIAERSTMLDGRYGGFLFVRGSPCGVLRAHAPEYQPAVATLPYPALEDKAPLGSLIYDPTVSGNINVVGDFDTCSIAIDPGQTMTVVVDPADGLQPTATLLTSDGVPVATATAAVPGANVILQTIPIGQAGTYTIQVGGAGDTVGSYTAQVILNAAAELEPRDLGTNNTPATAQNIDPSFINLTPRATRGAALGNFVLDADVDYYSFSMGAGEVATVTLNALTPGTVDLQVLDTSGLSTESSRPATNVDRYLRFAASTPGTYYARVSGSPDVAYSVVVARNAVFDITDRAAARVVLPLGKGDAFGWVGPRNGRDVFVMKGVAPGGLIQLRTATPGDGPSEPANAPNPRLDLRFNGVIVAEGIKLPDGRNEWLHYTVPLDAGGDYRVGIAREGGTSGAYTLSVGAPETTIVIEPPKASVLPGDQVTLSAFSCWVDALGQAMIAPSLCEPAIVQWSVNGPIGSLDTTSGFSTTLLASVPAGNVAVSGQVTGQADDGAQGGSGVAVSKKLYLVISPSKAFLGSGERAEFVAYECPIGPDGKPELGADGVPGNSDDMCLRTSVASWSLSSDSGVGRLSTTGLSGSTRLEAMLSPGVFEAKDVVRAIPASPDRFENAVAEVDITVFSPITINAVHVVEGDRGMTSVRPVVSLERPGILTTVDVATQPDSAIGDVDFVTMNKGQVTFKDDESSKPVEIRIKNDTTAEPTRQFFVKISISYFGRDIFVVAPIIIFDNDPIPPGSVRPGDFDGDGDVDPVDVALFDAAFGSRTGQPAFLPAADFDRNGMIDDSDRTIMELQLLTRP